jgi:hypothetical protein
MKVNIGPAFLITFLRFNYLPGFIVPGRNRIRRSRSKNMRLRKTYRFFQLPYSLLSKFWDVKGVRGRECTRGSPVFVNGFIAIACKQKQ